MMLLSRALINYHTRQLRQSPATGIFLTCGWLAGVLLTFVPGQLIAANHASLEALFSYLPWVMAVLIPTLTMPVASEGARGVAERLLTLPQTTAQRLFSRFAVYWALLGIWVLGFWPLVATLYYLGNPDFGPIATGLIGTWLLAAPLLAISLGISLRAKSGVGGLLGSLSACLILMLLGTRTVSGWFAGIPGLGWLPSVTHVTLLGAYAPFTAGLLNLSALLLLAGLTLMLLGYALTYRATPRHGLPTFAVGSLLFLIALLPGLNWWQLDSTTDALHTPSAVTIATLRQLPKPVTFTLHMSENNPDIPPAVHQTVHALENLLLTLHAAAHKRVTVRFSNADASTAAAITALQAGAAEQSLPTGTTYFAALTAEEGGHTAVIPAIDPSRQPVQEYDVMALLARATRTTPPTIAILSGGRHGSQLEKSLQGTFNLKYVTDTADLPTILSGTSVLMLPDDAPMPEPAIAAVRTYLGSGGNVMLFTDPFSRGAQSATPLPNEQRLSSLLPEWGITYTSETIIADPSQPTLATQSGAGAMAYPYWLQLGPQNLDKSLPFTTGINKLFWPEGGELLLTTPASTTLTLSPVITTSNAARAVSLTTFQSTPAELANTNLPAAAGPHILAAMSSGAFTPEATGTGNLLVFADADWITDTAIAQSPDNLTFLTAALHYFSGQSTLTQLRAKGTDPRTLTRIEDMANRLTRATATTEQKIATRLYEVSQSRTSPDAVANAEEEEFTLRQQLREIRARTRHRLQLLEDALLLLNLALMPTVTGVLFYLQRRRQRLKATSTL